MKRLLVALKLVKERYMYGVTIVCLVCGDNSPMVEIEQFRDRPNAVDEVRAYMVGLLKLNEPYSRCRACRTTNIAFRVNTLQSTDYRRLWWLAFVLIILAAIGNAG